MKYRYMAIYDKDTGEYINTGYNSTSRRQLKKEYLTLIHYDIAEEDRELFDKSTIGELLEMGNFELHTSKTPF